MNMKVRKICEVAIFSAIALIVSLISLPIPFIPTFYKIDLSLVITCIVAYRYGISIAILTEFIKNILSIFILGSNTVGIGELANFIMAISFIIPAFLFKDKSKFNYVIAICSLTIVGCITNYFILLPLYAKVFNMNLQAIVDMGHALNPMINNIYVFILLAVAPFNIIKGVVVSMVSAIINKRLKF